MKNKTPRHLTRAQVEIQHSFTAEEYKAKSETLAQCINNIALKREAIKAAAATAKAEIQAMESEMSELANQLRLGTEPKMVEAVVEMDRKTGTKTFRFADGSNKGKVIKKVAMSEDDYQQLPLEDEPKAASAPAPAATVTPAEASNTPPAAA